MQTLGAQLKARRLACGLTREQVSEQSGVKEDHIRYIEHDRIDFPRKRTLEKLTRVLACRVSVIVEAVDATAGSEEEA